MYPTGSAFPMMSTNSAAVGTHEPMSPSRRQPDSSTPTSTTSARPATPGRSSASTSRATTAPIAIATVAWTERRVVPRTVTDVAMTAPSGA